MFDYEYDCKVAPTAERKKTMFGQLPQATLMTKQEFEASMKTTVLNPKKVQNSLSLSNIIQESEKITKSQLCNIF